MFVPAPFTESSDSNESVPDEGVVMGFLEYDLRPKRGSKKPGEFDGGFILENTKVI